MKTMSRMFARYAREKGFALVAFPMQEATRVSIALIAPDRIIDAMENQSRMITRLRGESYARFRELYTATKVAPELRPVKVIQTDYRKINDMIMDGMTLAKSFEIVTARYTFGIVIGNDNSKTDVDSPVYGLIECKIGGSILAMQDKIEKTIDKARAASIEGDEKK